MLTPESIAHIKAFFQSPTKFDSFTNWQLVIKSLEQEPTVARSWFYFWMYQNVQIRFENEEYWLSPYGFYFFNAVRLVSARRQRLEQCQIVNLQLDLVELSVPDPSELYQKLKI